MKKRSLFVNILFIVLLEITVSHSVMRCDTSKNLLGGVDVRCIYVNCPKDSVVAIFENGILRRKFTYIGCKDSGEFVYFAENGDTITKSYFLGEKTIGIEKQWYNRKKIELIRQFNQSGLKHGLSESWREDGTRKDSIVYTNGEILEERVYFSNGKPRIWAKCKGEMVTATAAFPDGSKLDKNVNPVIEAEYYSLKTGKVISTVKNGNGKAIYYSEDGLSRYYCEYNNGVPVNLRELTSNEFPEVK